LPDIPIIYHPAHILEYEKARILKISEADRKVNVFEIEVDGFVLIYIQAVRLLNDEEK